ncbi:MAG TPA: gluconate 2-dehydrogenase subunit 3 family protein [Longimicrobiales bacterium]|nr:gluconate 2-dehydrogenase subunit 3 family protein [Longimicrobiales bacterium]
MSDPVLPPLRAVFRAIARTVVPEAAALDGAAWDELERIVERALAARPPKLRRQLGLLIRMIDVLAVLRHGRRFAALDDGRRARLLGALQDSRLLLLRRGIWGLRTLVFMGYYARPAAAEAIGYRADPAGWEARR